MNTTSSATIAEQNYTEGDNQPLFEAHSTDDNNSQSTVEEDSVTENALYTRLNQYTLFKSVVDTASSGYDSLKTRSEYVNSILTRVEQPVLNTMKVTHDLLDSSLHVDNLACKALDVNDSVVEFVVEKKDRAVTLIHDGKEYVEEKKDRAVTLIHDGKEYVGEKKERAVHLIQEGKENLGYYYGHRDELVDDMVRLKDGVIEQIEEVIVLSKEYLEDKKESGKQTVVDKYQDTYNYGLEKVNTVKERVQGVKDYSLDTVNSVKERGVERVQEAKDYGLDTVNSVKERVQGAKDYSLETVNNVKVRGAETAKDILYFCE